MKQCRAIPIVRSVVVLGLVSAGLSRSAASQTSQAEEPAGTSTSQNTSLAGALFAPMLPDAPGFSTTTAAATPRGCEASQGGDDDVAGRLAATKCNTY